MENIYVGKVTILVNAQANGVHTLSREEDRLIGESLVNDVNEAKRKHPGLDIFSIELVEIKRGCLLASFDVWLAWASVVAVAGGAATVVKNYPEYREGLITLFKDIKNVKNRITGKHHSTCIYKAELPFELELKKIEEEKNAKK